MGPTSLRSYTGDATADRPTSNVPGAIIRYLPTPLDKAVEPNTVTQPREVFCEHVEAAIDEARRLIQDGRALVDGVWVFGREPVRFSVNADRGPERPR